MRPSSSTRAVSLDGFLARTDGSVDWLFTLGDYGMSAFFARVDTVLIGRKTHDFMLAHGMPPIPDCATSSSPARATAIATPVPWSTSPMQLSTS